MCCCPMYTIRCHALQFKLSKSQKKTLRKFNNFIETGKRPGSGTEKISEPGEGSEGSTDKELENQRSKAEERLNLKNPGDIISSNEDKYNDLNKSEKIKPSQGSSSASSIQLTSDTRRIKGKLYRRQRWRKNQDEKGMVHESKKGNEEKSLEDHLEYGPGVHKFETRLVPADPDDDKFTETFLESYAVYQKYQVAVHNDTPDKCSPSQYKRFLCKVKNQLLQFFI